MKYYQFELTKDTTGETEVYMVRRDSIPYWFETYINRLDSDCHLTTRGRIEMENEYRNFFKI